MEQLNHFEKRDRCNNNFSPNEMNCSICYKPLQEPYISCNDCDALLCLHCFSQGCVTSEHENTHAYILRRDDVQIFPAAGNWTVREENILLNVLRTEGYGNWSAVARSLNYQRSKAECRKHYHDCYFGGIFERLLNLQHERDAYFPQRLPYIAKLRTVDPARNDDDITSIQYHQFLAGYRAARGEFITSYDHTAENLLTTISVQDSDFFQNKIDASYSDTIEELKCALVNAYNHRLKERYRRYKIMRDHGLLMGNRTLSWISKYSEALNSNVNCSRFLTFMQISNPLQFDLLIESFNLFAGLRRSLLSFYDARQNGITTLNDASMYFKLKKTRLKFKDRNFKNQYNWRKLLTSWQGLNDGQPLNKFLIFSSPAVGNQRRKPPPLDIIGLPGFTKLSEDERKLCSTERMAPEAYLDYKTVLLAENTKIGNLRLADARRLIKIDVNKTRKIYDFLLEHGHINKSS